ncbi:MAG TPA: response regulator transcription factor [Thermoanaerobaculia bacterium]|jgi:DNA-binding NarL/FixJ family response regulator|nr:response regulator transcription factor [Thermoanaerobaculia bacterium]
MNRDDSIRVAIVEDDRITREGLRLLIDGTPGYRCTATFGALEPALAAGAGEAPDVILLDIGLPGVPGSQGVGSLRARWPTAVVVMLTALADDDKVFESLCNGATGYLLKRTPPARLLEAVREAREGGAPMSPEIARKVVERLRGGAPPVVLDDALTPQEVHLLRLLAEGCTYQVAGEQLGISINTVRNYIRNIYEKLQVHTKSEAVSKGMRAGLL